MRNLLPAALVLGASLHGDVSGSGLQVSPTTITLRASQTAEGLWLSNIGSGPVTAQVRVYRWTQEDGENKEIPSREVLASPPMIQLDKAERQLIRLIRTAAPAESETAYRVVIDELPIPGTEPGNGVRFVLRYSVPVFLAPPDAGAAAGAAAHLSWNMRADGKGAVLEVNNTGNTHAQLAEIQFVDNSGKSIDVHRGLLGYVLGGAQMRWLLKAPAEAFSGGGTLQALINGSAWEQSLSPLEPAP
jgi:fimbrial chaperone protein